MNRRRQKKQSVDYLEVIQNKWTNLDLSALHIRLSGYWKTLPTFHQRALMALVPLVVIVMVIPFPSMNKTNTQSAKGDQRVSLTLNTRDEASSAAPATENRSFGTNVWAAYTIQTGDTLSKIFRSNGLPMADLQALIRVEGAEHPLSNVKPGQLIRYKLAADGTLDILQLEKADESVMFFRLSNGSFGRSK